MDIVYVWGINVVVFLLLNQGMILTDWKVMYLKTERTKLAKKKNNIENLHDSYMNEICDYNNTYNLYEIKELNWIEWKLFFRNETSKGMHQVCMKIVPLVVWVYTVGFVFGKMLWYFSNLFYFESVWSTVNQRKK